METLQVPETMPVMTLPDTVFFPQALLPLHIFEPRYRQMLSDVLTRDRFFAVARLDKDRSELAGCSETPHPIASVGIIRACQKAEGDTSNLLLQGICRVEILATVREQPYPIMQIRPLTTTAGGNHAQLELERLEIMRLLNIRRRLGTTGPKGMTQFLESIEDFGTFTDIAAFNLCQDSVLKQKLLEELDTRRRMRLFATCLKTEIEGKKLTRKLQGQLPDDQIIDN